VILGAGDPVAGVARVDEVIKEMGLEHTQIDHPPAYVSESLEVDPDNWITAADANHALTQLYLGKVLNPFWTKYLLDQMTGVYYGLNYLLAVGPPSGSVSHKNGFFPYQAGWVDNDIGLVRFERNGREYAYAISFFSNAVPTKFGDVVLAQDLSVTVWDYFDQMYQ
jgi:hypothetical protein